MIYTNTCCPELSEGKNCDYLDLVYRLKHPTEVITNQREQDVTVEVAIHVRLERCTGALKLGNLVYSTTLLPGEKVKLFSINRRSRFHFDSESNMTYRHEQNAEEQYFMGVSEDFLRNLDSGEGGMTSSTTEGETSSTGSSRGALGTIFRGPSVNVAGSFNAHSTSEFTRDLHIHAEGTHNKGVEMTRMYGAISVGEVGSRQHAEGETESQLESASRIFQNKNACHAVTYLFHQIDKEQTVKFEVKAVKLRVVDPAGDSSVENRPVASDDKLSVIPTGVLATSDAYNAKVTPGADVDKLAAMDRLSIDTRNTAYRVSHTQKPLDVSIRDVAIRQVQQELTNQGILDKSGNVSQETVNEVSFEFHSTIPTPGIIVKGCLDECNVCEPQQQEYIKADLENKQLQNELLKKQIELLQESQEYRCCPPGETEPVENE